MVVVSLPSRALRDAAADIDGVDPVEDSVVHIEQLHLVLLVPRHWGDAVQARQRVGAVVGHRFVEQPVRNSLRGPFEPFRITAGNRAVTEAQCRRCHAELVASMGPTDEVSCIRCHEPSLRKR